MLKKHTELQTIKFKSAPQPEDAEDSNAHFKQEIEFYTNKKLTEHKLNKKFESRHQDCEPESMFENMLELLEKKSK